jgi:uncharacterized damage-inducible protein DinB
MKNQIVNQKEIFSSNNNLFERIFDITSRIPDGLVNQSNGSKWSIGEIIEHIIKTQVGTIRILRAQSSEVSRSPLEKVESFQTIFGDDSTQLQAGPAIMPDDTPKDLERMIAKLKSNNNALTWLIKDIDLEKEYHSFSHPRFGILTGAEWILFTIAHTDRHLRQIERLLAK